MSLHFFDSISSLAEYIHNYNTDQQVFVTESNCLTSCFERLPHPVQSQPYFCFPAGESHKSISTYLEGIDFLTERHLDRSTLIYTLGGGVTTDLGGFMAATYKRGIRYINIPTSLMAMVDAAIGGKVGINHKHLKNYIGSFYHPQHVLICTDFLTSLPEKQILSGYAEVLKHGLIRDKSYWKQVRNIKPLQLSANDWLPIVKRSTEIKTAIVNQDQHETGLRKILNFGHTVGHAFETHLLNEQREVPHGYAVAAGMICEAFLSHTVGQLKKDEMLEITHYIDSVYDRLPITTNDCSALLELMRFDKKNTSGSIQFALLSAIGSCSTTYNVSEKHILEALHFYLS
ncbi:MAG: 3-dehydroquinate synthase [Bacteroidia bacterium]|nr:3-dehydroquinate synthase [Bacteroidia bacterium]